MFANGYRSSHRTIVGATISGTMSFVLISHKTFRQTGTLKIPKTMPQVNQSCRSAANNNESHCEDGFVPTTSTMYKREIYEFSLSYGGSCKVDISM